MGLEPTSGSDAATCFQDRPLIRPDGFREVLNSSSGGWNRTSGLRVQSAGVTTSSNCPGFGKEDSNPHRLIQSQGAYPLADSRERPAGVEPACRTWEARPDRSARDASTVASSAGSGSRTPVAWLEARSHAVGPIPRPAGGRRGSRTLKAHRSPGFEPGAVAVRLALPHRRAPAAGIEPASPRLTAGRSYQHELHRNRHVRQSGWPDLNRRSPAPEAGGLPGFPTSRVVSFSDKCPAGVEPARPPWQGGRLPLHHGHDRRRPNCQRAESTGWDSNPRRRLTRAVSSPLDDQCLHRNGTGGARTLTNPVKSRTFCR